MTGDSIHSLEPPPGFRGLDPDLPITCYRRRLPQWRQAGATYFVSFRLADSLPKECLDELRHLKREWELKHPVPRTENDWQEYAKLIGRRGEYWLDQLYGSCVLRESGCGEIVEDALRFFDEVRYQLGALVTMPNHVHVVVRPFDAQFTLENVLQSWKGFTSREINKKQGTRGMIWQAESHDRLIRDCEHLLRAIRYIGKNPSKAGIADGTCPMWVREDWAEMGYSLSADDGT